ncbi:hypothetical protein VNI00_005931 [Paramarasmius palmivorus]|uniref:Muskelin n=1 Tax=Paramarasmius palmivorus TaxID=297713 RepID=A0AAW0DAP5_9AGAR
MDIPAIETKSVPLTYSIDASTPPSGRYVAENVLIDKPADQSMDHPATAFSRHCQLSASGAFAELLLKLLAPESITFGKYHKAHPCNMKDFKIYVGMTRDQMVQVLHGSLKNDSIPETFSLKHIDDSGLWFPTRFIKIVPLSAHGASFNSSIWHISMTGIVDEAIVDRVKRGYDEYRESQALRYLLKHLRQRRLLSPYHAILSRVGTSLQPEHPLASELHSSVVLHGDWSRAEDILDEMSEQGLFSSYLEQQSPHIIWTKLPDGPSPRAGHAMCMDQESGLIYLFGGWNGQKNLDDFWVYEIQKREWRTVPCCSDTPSARSCHKMVYDEKTRSIYLLGRMDADGIPKGVQNGVVNGSASNSSVLAELYRYRVDAEAWELVKPDSTSPGGPPLIYDHQMVMDSGRQVLYVSGGRTVNITGDVPKYSGLYAFEVATEKWSLLPHAEMFTLRSGHAMVLDPNMQTLFVLFGQQGDRGLSDIHSYHIPTRVSTELTSCAIGPEPDSSSVARAVINSDLKEIYVHTGLLRSHSSSSVFPVDSPMWLYRYGYSERNFTGKWIQLSSSGDEAPEPRSAHDIVYDQGMGALYMFGGNTGAVKDSESDKENQDGSGGGAEAPKDEGRKREKMTRLGDFWAMTVERPSSKEIIRRATFYLRQQQFKEMCTSAPQLQALSYLQNQVSEVVNHSDPEEAETFRSLLTHLLSSASPPSSPYLTRRDAGEDEPPPRKRSRSNAHEHTVESLSLAATMLRTADPLEPTKEGALSDETFACRNGVFEKILEFVNEDAKQPTDSLLDLFGLKVQ